MCNDFQQIIKKLNFKKKVKIRLKPIKENAYSIYFDIWINNQRQYKTTYLYLKNTKKSKIEDKENIKIASSMRDKLELELFQSHNDFYFTNWKKEANFIEYFHMLLKTKHNSTWKNSYSHLIKYFGNKKISFVQIEKNKKIILDFIEYLKINLSNNSVRSYFARIKTAFNIAIKEGVIESNPLSNSYIKSDNPTIHFLNIEELKILRKTNCINDETKNAFFFSCFTGLRYSDVIKISYTDITENILYFKQTKTSEMIRIKLHNQAQEIIQVQKQKNYFNENVIFNLCSPTSISRHMKDWISKSGINKKITFHCSRHTFATMCLTYDIDIYTVSKLLGHKDLRMTQIYAKLIDKKKDEAIDKLPEI